MKVWSLKHRRFHRFTVNIWNFVKAKFECFRILKEIKLIEFGVSFNSTNVQAVAITRLMANFKKTLTTYGVLTSNLFWQKYFSVFQARPKLRAQLRFMLWWGHSRPMLHVKWIIYQKHPCYLGTAQVPLGTCSAKNVI